MACSDLQTNDSSDRFGPFASIADAKEGMCVLLDALNTCQHKSYPKGQLFNRSKLGTCPIHIIYIVTWCVDRRGSRFQGLVKPLAKCLKTCTFFMTFMLNSQALVLQSTVIPRSETQLMVASSSTPNRDALGVVMKHLWHLIYGLLLHTYVFIVAHSRSRAEQSVV